MQSIIPNKAMTTAPDNIGTMANGNNIQLQFYNKPDCLSSTIDYLLACFLFFFEGNGLTSPERATALTLFDRLLRFKIDLKQSKGMTYDR